MSGWKEDHPEATWTRWGWAWRIALGALVLMALLGYPLAWWLR